MTVPPSWPKRANAFVLRNLPTLPGACKRKAHIGIKAVFLSGATGPGQVEQEINVVKAARTAGVTRLVKVSVWVAAEEQFALARVQRKIERAAEASGRAWTFLRPSRKRFSRPPTGSH